MTQAPPAPQQPIEQPTPHQPTRPAIERRAVERWHAPRGADLMNQQSTLDGDD